MERRISHLNWQEIKEHRENIDRIILPVGTMEAHGPGPTGTDSEIPARIAEEIAPAVNALILPTVYYGVTSTLLPYPGSIDITEETLHSIILNIALSVQKDNYRYFIILNGHGGNNNVLSEVKKEIYKKTGMFVIILHWWEFAYAITERIYGIKGGHGGVDETAMMIHIAPESVKQENYSEKLHYLRNNSVDSIPVPGPLIEYDNKGSRPDYNKDNAERFFNEVVSAVQDEMLSIIEQMEIHLGK